MKYSDWSLPEHYIVDYEKYLLNLIKRVFRTRVPIVSEETFIKRYAENAAVRMITAIAGGNFRTWRQAASASMRGPKFYEALQQELSGPVGARVRELVAENAKVIRTMPLSVATRVTEHVAREQQAGTRAATVAGELGISLPRFTRAHLKLIARTEVSKASTALTQARSEDLGLEWYVWRSSQDQRVRPSHRIMEGVLIRWDHPASPEKLDHKKSYGAYAPGNIFNCRCYAQPLLRPEDVTWPHRVFYGERILTMTRASFSRIYQTLPLAA